MELYEQMESVTKLGRDAFRQAIANARYFRSKLLAEIMRLAINGIKAQVDGKDRDQILDEIEECDQQILEWEYLTICRSILREDHHEWDYATSSLFIVLPADLSSWDDQDPATHQFRFYFLCDNHDVYIDSQDTPSHIHLSDHPGYDLKRPQEFFQAYGDYVLHMLRLIKNGYSDENYDIPALYSFDVLWSHDFDGPGDRLSKENITFLVDKAIDYLQELSAPKWLSALGLNHGESDAIKAFLEVVDGNDTEGNLHRFIRSDQRVFWVCQTHALQRIDPASLKQLQEFVDAHGGHVDMQHATLRVKLNSKSEGDIFCNLLTVARHVFDISVKLDWAISRLEVEKLCEDIAETGAVVLGIDGVAVNTHPQNNVQYMINLFGDIIAHKGIRLITLLNYPRPQEQCLYTGMFEVQLRSSPLRSTFSWVDLRRDLDKFSDKVSYVPAVYDRKAASRVLQSALAHHGFPDITKITIFHETWNGIFDLEKGAFVAVQSYDMMCPKVVVSSTSLQRLTQDLTNAEFIQDTYRTVESNAGLKELNISTYGRNVLHQAEQIVRLCRNSSRPLRLTLLDRMPDTLGRIVVQVTISGESHYYPNDEAMATSGIDAWLRTQEQSLNCFPEIDQLQWHLRLSDDSALFLDMVTEQHPLVLDLILDITELSMVGLSSVQNFLRRSSLEQVNILCSPFEPTMSAAITKVLCSVQWSVLKSLVLSGDSINDWIRLWTPGAAPGLLSLEIRGTGSTLQELSHSSVLFLHELVSTSLLVELRLENVVLQDKYDWVLIFEAMDPSLVRTCQLCERGINQLTSVTEAADKIASRFRVGQEGENAQLILNSFTLDISHRSRVELTSVQHILSRSNLSHLRIVCTPIDPGLAETVDQVFQAISWATVISLELCGVNIEEWLQFYASIEASELQRLALRGTRYPPQKLSNSSVQIVANQFLIFCPLEELTFSNVVLQDLDDWEHIVDAMDPLVLSVHMCKISTLQFLACSVAVDQFSLKYDTPEYASEDSESSETDMLHKNVGYSDGSDTEERGNTWSDESDSEVKGSTHILTTRMSD